MSSSYGRGYRAEQRAKRSLERRGYVVIRSAGSKQIDLIAAKNGRIRLVEVKYASGRLGKTQRSELQRLKAAFGVRHVEVWLYKPYRKKPEIKLI